MNGHQRIAGLLATGLGLAITGTALAQVPPATQPPGTLPPPAATPRVVTPSPSSTPQPARPAAQPSGDSRPASAIANRPMPSPAEGLGEIQDVLKMAFMAADQNHDGLISQQEANDAGNMLVGGVFFSADADGDGKVTPQEAQAVRQKILQQNPLLRFVIQRSQENSQGSSAGNNPVQGIGNLLDANQDKALSGAEIRQVVQTTVQVIYASADTNHDGQMSPTELNSAVYGLAKTAAQTAFQAADADRSNALSKEEFTKALAEPTQSAFDILDANLDGQLTAQELDRAGQVIASQIRAFRIPDARNSVDKLVQEGRRPGEAAPIPNFPVPNAGSQPNGNPGTQPAPASEPSSNPDR